MSRGPLAFKETDVARAIRAADKAGAGRFFVRLDPASGHILILPIGLAPTHSAPPAGDDDPETALDRELEQWTPKKRSA
jgi:hypothetical protein